MPDSNWPGLGLRQPPAYPEVEQALLGALLANNRPLEKIADLLEPEHFADPIHAAIYAAIKATVAAGGVASPLTLWPKFQNTGALDDAGGFAYLATLLAACVSPIAAPEYAKAIRDAWARRELIAMGEDLVNASFAPGDREAAQIAAAIEMRLADLGRANQAQRSAVSLDDAIDAAMAAADAAARAGAPAGLSTGMSRIDAALGGLENGTLTVVAGRPGMGKSSLVHQWAINAARAGVGVVEISLEMSAVQLGRRTLATAAGVPISRLKHGQHALVASQLISARKELRGLPLSIEDGAGLTSTAIAAKVRDARRRHGVGMILVDHLHIVAPDAADVKQGATWAIGRISGAMKRMAKDFDCPVVLAAQLNRGVEAREDKRPTLADLRQAGEIEQDADAVAMVYRPEYYLANAPERKPDESPARYDQRLLDYQAERERLAGVAEIIMPKIRDGEPQTVTLRWDGPTATFSEPTHD